MKKIITLALALVMVLGLAAPAMAYTTNVGLQSGVSPYSVDIYLVDHISTDFLSGWISMPATDRGYAKNEVIAFVGVLNVPSGYNVYSDGYREIRFTGKNVTLDVVDNMVTGVRQYNLVNNVPAANQATRWNINDDNNRLSNYIVPSVASVNAASITATPNAVFFPDNVGAKTYKWLGFGKVTGDDAKVTFSLSRAAAFATFTTPANWATFGSNTKASATQYLVLTEDLVVFRANNSATGPNTYWVVKQSAGFNYATETAANGGQAAGGALAEANLLFVIETGARGASERLTMFPNGYTGDSYYVSVEPSTQQLVFVYNNYNDNAGPLAAGAANGDQILYNGGNSYLYNALLGFYNQYFEGALGFTAYNRLNLLNRADWYAVANAAWDISETVDVEPWTPYVSVPENIVVDPPKTGDASVMGFVMIVLAAAAAVVVKKVRA